MPETDQMALPGCICSALANSNPLLEMKTRCSLLSVAFCLAGLSPGSISVASAQLLAEPGNNDSVVAAVAEAQGLLWVPPEQLPRFGTFWVVRNVVPLVLAPLPCAPLAQRPTVYAINDRQFLVDEMEGPLLMAARPAASLSRADYASLIQLQAEDLVNHIAFIQAAECGAQSRALAGEGPPWPGPGGGGGVEAVSNSPPIYGLGLGLCLYPPEVMSGGVRILITNTPESGWLTSRYDLYYTTNLALLPAPALCASNWAWLGRSEPGQTQFLAPGVALPEIYFRLGTLLDSDGDGLPDAYELAVAHTPANAFTLLASDGRGTPDAWYLSHHLRPAPGDGDTDGDGLADWREYQRGGDPRQPEPLEIWVGSPKGGAP